MRRSRGLMCLQDAHLTTQPVLCDLGRARSNQTNQQSSPASRPGQRARSKQKRR